MFRAAGMKADALAEAPPIEIGETWVERFNVHGSRLKSPIKLRFTFDYWLLAIG